MDFLNKFATKKNIFFASFATTAVLTLYNFIGGSSAKTSINDLSSATSFLNTFVVVYWIALVVSVIIAVLSGFYYFKKNKNEKAILGEFILFAVGLVLMLLSIKGVLAISDLLKALKSGNYMSILGMSVDYESLSNSMQYLQWFYYLMIGGLVYNGLLLSLSKKTFHINGFEFDYNTEGTNDFVQSSETPRYDPETGELLNNQSTAPKFDVNTGEILDNVNVQKDKAVSFFKTPTGKKVLAGVAAVVLCFGGYKIYDTFFNKTEIDVMPSLKVTFGGKDGQGYVTNCNAGDIQYDDTDQDLRNFVKGIYYDYGTSYKLKNGDKITVTAVYDKDYANQHNIVITNDKKEVTVKGLIEVYAKPSDVPEKVVAKCKENMTKKIESNYKDSSYTTYNKTFETMYLAYDKDSVSNMMVGVYKIEDSFKHLDGTVDTKTYYVYSYMRNIQSDFFDKAYTPSAYVSYIYDDTYDKLTDASKIEERLGYELDNYTLKEVKTK